MSLHPRPTSKAHASEIIRDVVENQTTMIITHNGEAKVILQDIHVYEQLQETLALLKMLAQSKKSQQAGLLKTLDEAFESVHQRAKAGRR